jgi:integrase
MSVYKRGKYFHYEFQFRGERIQVSSKSTSKKIASDLEKQHRRNLETGQQGAKPPGPKLTCGDELVNYIGRMEKHWAGTTTRSAQNSIKWLEPFFGKMSLQQIDSADLNRYQDKRLADGVKGRTINIELALLRMTMGKKLWALNSEGYRALSERTDVGRALNDDELERLLTSCKASCSTALYPAVLLSIHTGLRSAECKGLRWSQINLVNCTLKVGKSKTEAGTGRVVDLSPKAVAVLTDWKAKFESLPEHYVFPKMEYAFNGWKIMTVTKVIPTLPIDSFHASWKTAKRIAKVECRWHDLRHCFVSILASTGASDATVMSLAGHVSSKMLNRYSHTRNQERRIAILSAFGG